MNQTLRDVVLRLAQQELADERVVERDERDELHAIDTAALAPVIDNTRREEASDTAARTDAPRNETVGSDELVQRERVSAAPQEKNASDSPAQEAVVAGPVRAIGPAPNAGPERSDMTSQADKLAFDTMFNAQPAVSSSPAELHNAESLQQIGDLPRQKPRANRVTPDVQSPEMRSSAFVDATQAELSGDAPYPFAPIDSAPLDAPDAASFSTDAGDASQPGDRGFRQVQRALDEHGRQFEQIVGDLEAALTRLFGVQLDVLTRLREQADEHERRWVEHGAARRASF